MVMNCGGPLPPPPLRGAQSPLIQLSDVLTSVRRNSLSGLFWEVFSCFYHQKPKVLMVQNLLTLLNLLNADEKRSCLWKTSVNSQVFRYFIYEYYQWRDSTVIHSPPDWESNDQANDQSNDLTGMIKFNSTKENTHNTILLTLVSSVMQWCKKSLKSQFQE